MLRYGGAGVRGFWGIWRGWEMGKLRNFLTILPVSWYVWGMAGKRPEDAEDRREGEFMSEPLACEPEPISSQASPPISREQNTLSVDSVDVDYKDSDLSLPEAVDVSSAVVLKDSINNTHKHISQYKQPKKVIAKIVDSRNKRKLDLNAAIQLYMKGIKEAEISKLLDVSRQAVNIALKPFKEFIRNPEHAAVYAKNKAQIIDTVEMEMTRLLLDKEKVKKATLGNIAYAFTQLHNAGRLEKDLSTANLGHNVRFTVRHETVDGNDCQPAEPDDAANNTISCVHTPSEEPTND